MIWYNLRDVVTCRCLLDASLSSVLFCSNLLWVILSGFVNDHFNFWNLKFLFSPVVLPTYSFHHINFSKAWQWKLSAEVNVHFFFPVLLLSQWLIYQYFTGIICHISNRPCLFSKAQSLFVFVSSIYITYFLSDSYFPL